MKYTISFGGRYTEPKHSITSCSTTDYNLMEVGGIEPHTRVVAQRLTPYYDQIVTIFWSREWTDSLY